MIDYLIATARSKKVFPTVSKHGGYCLSLLILVTLIPRGLFYFARVFLAFRLFPIGLCFVVAGFVGRVARSEVGFSLCFSVCR